MARPWYGNGPLTQADTDRGDVAWRTVAPTAAPLAEGYSAPRAFERGDFDTVKKAFVDGVRRARGAGFEIIELHGATATCCILPFPALQHAHRRVRRQPREPHALPARGGCSGEEGVGQAAVRAHLVDRRCRGRLEPRGFGFFRKELKKVGVDVIDCSSGGIQGSATAATKTVLARVPGFQLPFSETIRKEAGIATMAVGLILTPQQAEAALAAGRADLIAVGREALFDPNWPAHAAHALGADAEFADWPQQYGWWLTRRESLLKKLGIR